jgi:hypothetical protein
MTMLTCLFTDGRSRSASERQTKVGRSQLRDETKASPPPFPMALQHDFKKRSEVAIMPIPASNPPSRLGQALPSIGKLKPISVTKQFNEAIAWHETVAWP